MKYSHRVLQDGPWTFDGYATSIREYLFPKNQSVYILAIDDFNLWMQASKYPTMRESVNLELLGHTHIEQVRKTLYPILS